MARPTIIAICGGTGSGKTTLARAVAAAAGEALILSEDSYYHCATTRLGFDPATYNFDAPEAKDLSALARDLAALREGRAIAQPIYDFTTHRRLPDTRPLAPAPVIVLEGLHALGQPELRALLSLAVFIDAPEAVRLARRLRRDVAERGRTMESVLDQFFSAVRPMHALHVAPLATAADIVLDSEAEPPGALAQRVLAQLEP